MKKNKKIDVRMINVDAPKTDDNTPVDAKLVALAEHLHARLVTNDYNLSKIAQLRNVDSVNINDLANALRPVVLPGDGTIMHGEKDLSDWSCFSSLRLHFPLPFDAVVAHSGTLKELEEGHSLYTINVTECREPDLTMPERMLIRYQFIPSDPPWNVVTTFRFAKWKAFNERLAWCQRDDYPAMVMKGRGSKPRGLWVALTEKVAD